MTPLTAYIVPIAMTCLLVGTPILLLGAGIILVKRARSFSGKILIASGSCICLTCVSAVVAYVLWVGPGRSGVVSHGKSPDGLEYCVVQTYKHLLGEPYQVSFYVRDVNGVWRWSYLEHEDVAWRAAQVNFANGKARVSRNGKPFCEIPIPAGAVDLSTVQPGYRDDYLPAKFAVEDVVRHHNTKFRE